MAYNDFTLETLKEQFGLKTDERGDYFAQVEPVTISETLRNQLRKHAPRAIAIGTEKARSEFIIAPVLFEVLEQYQQDVSLFSGVEFNPDPERGLRGVCDFILSQVEKIVGILVAMLREASAEAFATPGA